MLHTLDSLVLRFDISFDRIYTRDSWWQESSPVVTTFLHSAHPFLVTSSIVWNTLSRLEHGSLFGVNKASVSSQKAITNWGSDLFIWRKQAVHCFTVSPRKTVLYSSSLVSGCCTIAQFKKRPTTSVCATSVMDKVTHSFGSFLVCVFATDRH